MPNLWILGGVTTATLEAAILPCDAGKQDAGHPRCRMKSQGTPSFLAGVHFCLSSSRWQGVTLDKWIPVDRSGSA